MLKRIMVLACLASLAAAPAFAQKAEVGVTFGWVYSDGVDFGSNVPAPGGVYSRVDPKDSFGWGIDVGFFVGPNAEVGFLYGNQLSTLQVSGTKTVDVGDMSISTYHGTFTYNFGESDAKVRPVLHGRSRCHELRRGRLHREQGARDDQELDEVLRAPGAPA